MQSNYLQATRLDIEFSALFEFAPISIVVVNKDGKVLSSNPIADQQFKYGKGELTGRLWKDLIISENDSSCLRRVGYYREPVGDNPDVYALRKDGSKFPVEVSWAPDQPRTNTYAIAFVKDLTERKEAQVKEFGYLDCLEEKVKERTRKLEESLAKEHELNELKSRFVSLASHEFRTPLSTIMSSAALLESYTGPEHKEKKEKHIHKIKSSVKNLIQVMDDFLSLDKLKRGKIEAGIQELDLKALISEVVDELGDVLKQGQCIKVDHSGPQQIYNDPKLLRNVLINLISNASKYSFENEEIKVSSEVGEKAMVSVSDHGIGIPRCDQQKLFGPFFRASNVGNISGTGLGLNIVKKYVDLMGGAIAFDSNDGDTTFTVILPVLR